MIYIIGILILVYLYCIMPRMFHRPDYTELKKSVFAHRGFHDKEKGIPENSMTAFREAIKYGYGIETDIQLTKDKKVVVFHDFNLKRVCGVDKKVSDMTYAELRELTLFDSNEHIPLFSEFLKMVNGKVPLLIELKCKGSSDKIAPLADRVLRGYKGVYYIQSFHPLALKWYKENRSEIIRGQLADCYKLQKRPSKNLAFFLQQHLIFNIVCRPDFISYNYKHHKEISLNICKYVFGCPLAAWTVRSEEKLKKVKKKFDVIIFEYFNVNNH